MSFSNEFNGQKSAPLPVSGNTPIAQDDDQASLKAQAIINNATTITNSVLAQRQTALPGQKVILGMGELHENGLHVLQQIAILDSLKKSGLNCATALEWPSNNIDLHIEEIFKAETTDKTGLIEMLEADDNSSLRNRLSADTTPIRSANARLSRALLHEFMDDNLIPAFCTDAPRDWELFIENQRKAQHLLTDDPRVADAVDEAMRILNLPNDHRTVPPVDSLKQLGMLARNIYITNEADRILQEHPEIDVVLIEAGRAHITGNDLLKPESSPYEHGMSNLVSQRSHHSFIGAPLYSSQEDKAKNTPPYALTDQQILDLDYLDKSPFNTNSSKVSDLKEADNIQSLSPHFPFIDDTLRGRTPTALYEERKATLSSDLRDLRDNNGFTLTKPEHYTPV